MRLTNVFCVDCRESVLVATTSYFEIKHCPFCGLDLDIQSRIDLSESVLTLDRQTPSRKKRGVRK